jgi:pimeloyl-ACP methyl ester carboxylesterase
MLHGVGRAGRTFSSFATMMPERFRVRTIDFRGHGKSGRAGDRYRVVDYVEDAVAVIEAIGRPTAVYGHSLGSLVAVAVAARIPHLVSAIVLEDPPSTAFWKILESTHYYPTFQAMRRWAGRRDVPLSELAQRFGQETLKTYSDGRVLRIADVRDAVSLRFTASCIRDLDPGVMQAILDGRWAHDYDFNELLRAVNCPTLLMRGDVAKGGMLPEEDAESIMNLLPDGVRIDFATAGHLLHWQVRSEAAMQTSAFLETVG